MGHATDQRHRLFPDRGAHGPGRRAMAGSAPRPAVLRHRHPGRFHHVRDVRRRRSRPACGRTSRRGRGVPGRHAGRRPGRRRRRTQPHRTPDEPMTLLLVILGGAVGAPVRYLTDLAMQRLHGTAFPWGTWTVNVAGSFVLGMVASSGPDWVVALAGTGFCGALTTFSTFGYE